MTTTTAYARPRVWQNDAMRRLQGFFDAYFADGGLDTMLDAGAGYELPIDVPSDVTLVGLDLSEAALAKNENVDEKLIGDMQDYPFPPEAYDAALSWWVLEHVPEPGRAIANVGRSLRPGGIFVVGIPYIWSLKGLLTKFTPFRFHVFVARRFLGYPEAGQPGTAPYRTYLSLALSPRRLERIAGEAGLSIAYVDHYAGRTEDKLPAPVRAVWKGISAVVRALSLGRYDPALSEYIVVLRKRA